MRSKGYFNVFFCLLLLSSSSSQLPTTRMRLHSARLGRVQNPVGIIYWYFVTPVQWGITVVKTKKNDYSFPILFNFSIQNLFPFCSFGLFWIDLMCLFIHLLVLGWFLETTETDNILACRMRVISRIAIFWDGFGRPYSLMLIWFCDFAVLLAAAGKNSSSAGHRPQPVQDNRAGQEWAVRCNEPFGATPRSASRPLPT